MRWIRVNDYDAMSEFGARRLFERIDRAARAGRGAAVGLATGNTMLRLYARLAERLNAARTPLAGLRTFNLDEYVGADGRAVPLDHPLSYRAYMAANLFARLDPALGFRPDHAHFPDAADPARYDADIRAAGGLDLQLLGIGFNGHIAFNEPIRETLLGAEAYARLPSRLVDLEPLTLKTNARLTAGDDLRRVPRRAATMGMAPILAAREILLLACFAEQAAPLNALRTGRITPELPASFLLRHRHAAVVYTADTLPLPDPAP